MRYARLLRRGRLRRHPVLRPRSLRRTPVHRLRNHQAPGRLADRHGDAVAGFDPADTTLSAGLPDTRTFDPFGNSTSATGLKYRIGYQGDWTDPRSGDVNQGARWYDPSTGTFNSRDTTSYAAGASSALPNLYAYASANPLTLNDPDGHRAVDPEGADLNRTCHWGDKAIGFIGDTDKPIYEWICENPEPPKDCKKTRTCDEKCDGKGKGESNCGGDDGGCKGKNCGGCKGKDCGGGGGGCKGKDCGGGGCKGKSCRPPKPPCNTPACKAQEVKEDIEDHGKNDPQPPPGSPACTNGNTTLCYADPTQPTTVVGTGGDLTDETGDYAETLYQQTLNQTGSVIGTVGATGSYNWFNMGMLPEINGKQDPSGGGGVIGRGGYGGAPTVQGTAIAGLLVGILKGSSIILLAIDAQDSGDSSGESASTGSVSGSAAQPPDDDPDWDGFPPIKPGSSGGPTGGKNFPKGTRNKVLEDNPDICVYCRMKTDKPQVDHVVPKSRGGNTDLDNGQTTCPWCNNSKNNRDYPVNPPKGYTGKWPPLHWPPR